MPDAENITRVATIVSAYLQHHSVPVEHVPALIVSVNAALDTLGKPLEVPASPPSPAVPIRRSVRPDAITCLECGWVGSVLRRHLGSAHQLTPEGYRARWGLGQDYPLTAPNYTQRRSELAKAIGLGRRRSQGTSRQRRSPKRG
jgi:predicted transcriptional regulator